MRRTVAFDDRTLCYGDNGTSRQGTVLALHSLGADGRSWDDVAEGLSDDGWRLLTPDARGHGGSTWAPMKDAAAWVLDILAVLDDADSRRVHVVGVSMGAAQALELALQVPERVASLFLGGAFGDLTAEQAAPKVDGLVGNATDVGMRQWADQYADAVLIAPGADRDRLRIPMRDMSLDAYATSARVCFAPRSASLDAIKVPVRVIWGTEDTRTPRAMATGLLEQLGHGELLDVEGAGHLPHLDAPERFLELMLEHLATAHAADNPVEAEKD